ncbi:hypothetical protein H8356DRAFT_1081731 [Neocallimastix lanati (nom. inval.)]|nr:hypothetical protein H8356DRAFT_1081731 [Neocallimastix sp. JGI-2020a]
MAQRKYNIPIDCIEEFFSTDYRLTEDEPAEEKDKQDITRARVSLEELGEVLENNLQTSHPRRMKGNNSPTTWNEVRIHLSARQAQENFRRRMNSLNNEIINTTEESESELLNLHRDLHRNEVTLTNEKTILYNESLINKSLPKELYMYKDVFQVPRELPPSRDNIKENLKQNKQGIQFIIK